MSELAVGLFPTVTSLTSGHELRSVLAAAAEVGVDHLCVGDHVSFFVGAGSDGLTMATALLAAQSDLPVYVALYLLPLRHPVPVARQLATITELAPGRLVFGVGIGGEDPHELEVCSVDPHTRGRRMDESLQILRGLGTGTAVSFEGEFFSLHDALVLPAPSPAMPLIVGGRSNAAARRAALLGDGWLGIWVSPTRYRDTCTSIETAAASAGRDPARFEHALNVWCGFGPTHDAARAVLADKMQHFYQMPFEPFARYSPAGTAEEVADFLRPYVDAGCSRFNVIPCADDVETAFAAVGEVRKLLQ